MPISEGRVAFRLPAEIHRQAKRAAQALGLTVSGWIRMVAIEALGRRQDKDDAAPFHPPEPDGTQPPEELTAALAQCACGWFHNPALDDETYTECPACGESFADIQ